MSANDSAEARKTLQSFSCSFLCDTLQYSHWQIRRAFQCLCIFAAPTDLLRDGVLFDWQLKMKPKKKKKWKSMEEMWKTRQRSRKTGQKCSSVRGLQLYRYIYIHIYITERWMRREEWDEITIKEDNEGKLLEWKGTWQWMQHRN